MNSFIPRGFPRAIWALFATSVINSIGFSITIPYLSLYLHNTLKISMTAVGFLLMSPVLVGSFAGLFGGELSDRLGRKYLMARSLLARVVTFSLLGLIILKYPSVTLIYILILINNILFAFYNPASQAYVADLTTADKRTAGYGLLRMGGNLGWALGPALGGILARYGYANLFFITAGFMLAGFAVFAIFGRESLVHVSTDGAVYKNIWLTLRDRRFVFFTFVCLLIFIVWGQLVSPLSVYAVNRVGITKTQLGILFSINGFMVVFFQYYISHLIREKKELAALAIGSLIYATGYLTVGFAASFNLLILSIAVITIGEMVITPASQSYASLIADHRHRGRYMGFFNLAQTLGWALGPMIGGVLLDAFTGRNLIHWSAIALIALVAGLMFLFFRDRRAASGRSLL